MTNYPGEWADDDSAPIYQDFLFGAFLTGLPDLDSAGTPIGGTALYRFFAANGDLLYVGITGDLVMREKDHASSKAWYADVHAMTVVWYRDREAAVADERQAIRDEMPRFNSQNNPSPRRPIRPGPRRTRRASAEILKAHAAYNKSVRAGQPLTDRALGEKFGKSRTWGANRIRECESGPHLAAKTG